MGLLFPGQGAQSVGMGRELYDESSAARDVFERADAALGSKLSQLIFEGPQHQLQLTENAQPAIVTVSVAVLEALRQRVSLSPLVAAGHSLGEYSALVASGALSFEDAVRAVRLRGQLMQQAVPQGQGAMAAVLGLDADTVAAAVAGACVGDAVVAVSGYNTPEQTTISGNTAGIRAARAAVEVAGAQRVIALAVSAPFHSPLMAPVEEPLRRHLAELAWQPMTFAVVSNVDAAANDDSAAHWNLLVRQLTGPVRWVETVRCMIDLGTTRFMELGPGRSLSTMLRKIDSGLKCTSVRDKKSLDRGVAT